MNAILDDRKTVSISEWFDNLVHGFRVDQLQLESGVASKEKEQLYNTLIGNNQIEIAKKGREFSSMALISSLMSDYVTTLKDKQPVIKSLSLQLSDSKVLVWAVVNDDDEESIDKLFLSEAFVNSKYSDLDFSISSTIIEESDNCPIPSHFQQLI